MPIIRLLAPPYRNLSWVTDGLPPLGTIAVVDACSIHAVSDTLHPLLTRAPWCVPCLLTSADTALPGVLVAIHELPGQPTFLARPAIEAGLTANAVAAVLERPVPGGARLADYVVRRTGLSDLRVELAQLLGAPGECTPLLPLPERTLRDRLRWVRPLTAHCWRAIGSLCRVAAGRGDESVSELAARAGVGPRTLRAWVRRYLGASMPEFRLRSGWEWVLEAALRTASLVEAAPWTRPLAITRGGASGGVTVPPSLLKVPNRPARRVPSGMSLDLKPVEIDRHAEAREG